MSSGDLGGVGEVEFWRAETRRLAVENVVLMTRVADLEGQVGALAEKVSVLARLAFGTSSEKSKQAPGGDGATGEAGNDPAGGPDQRGRGRPAMTGPAGGTGVAGGSGGAGAGTAAATTPICRAAKRSTTFPRPSGGARAAARGMSGSARRAASRSTGRSS